MTPHVAVVGAGAFGGWSALYLRRAGARVTLLDAWGAGNSRASSGGETRIIRGIYGGNRRYVELTMRSLALWREHEARWRRKLYHRTGALWMYQRDDNYARSTIPLLEDMGYRVVEWSPGEAAGRFPQIDFTGIRSVFHEPEAGYLLARVACETVREGFLEEGGEYRTSAVRPARVAGRMAEVALSDGTALRADHFVFACGPWLGELFPDAIGSRVRATRQEEFFFGVPAGDTRFGDDALPAWVDHGERFMYGIPGNEGRGFKLADDTRGTTIDPTSEQRLASLEALARARATLARRFPALADAPLVETRVCQYEQTPDGHFIIDRLPGTDNVWLVGGGSGHGFKMGPAIGEEVARLVLGQSKPEPQFSLARLP